MDQVQNMELSKDQIIQELIALLNRNQQKEAANNVFEMAALIDGMGKRLEQVTEELNGVRKQLEKMEQEKADKTLKAAVRKAVDSLEQQCRKMKGQLSEIRTEVKTKASEIVEEAKTKGKAVLYRVSEFLGIKDKLESVRENIRKGIGETEQTISKIDSFGSGMREAGQKIANTFRIVNSLAKEPERMQEVDMAEPAMLGVVTEPEFQYGAEAFEMYQKIQDEKPADIKSSDSPTIKAGKSR